MKSQLKKLKGTSLKTQIGDLILRQPFRVDESDFDQIYFYTQLENTICKLYDLDRDISIQRFQNEKHNYQESGLSMLAQIICAEEFKNKKRNYGYFIINKIQKQSSILQKPPNSQQILILATKLMELIVQMKKKRQVVLNFRPENIVRDTNNNYVLLQPTYITACAQNVKITRQKLENLHHFLFENIEKQFKYYSPQLLDNYYHGQIDYHSDMFVMGCILYECLTSAYPFQSRLSALNLQPHRKFQQIQNSTLRVVISMLLKPPGYRAQPQQLLTVIGQHKTILKKNLSNNSNRQIHSDEQVEEFQFFKQNNPIHRVQSTNDITNKVDTTFLDGIKSVFNKYKNSSQGWFLNFTENNNSNPLNQYMESCLAKLYKKSDKIDKLSLLIKKHIFNANNSLHYFILKSLIFIGNLLRKGPPSVFDHSKIWLEILQNIASMNIIAATSGLIFQLVKILKQKLEVNNKVKSCFQGNFYLINCALFKAVKLEHLALLSEYLKGILNSLNTIIQQSKVELYQTVLTWICDQLYDLISILTLSVISIRKDNQLKLRTDNLDSLRPIERNINAALKKMSSFAGQMNFHPIYELESDYSFYQQQIFLKQSPQSTTFQHFYRSAKMYKGLRIPINYPQAYTTNKSYDSGQISHSYQKTYAEYNQVQVNKTPFSKSDQFQSDPQLDNTIKIDEEKRKQRISLQFQQKIHTNTKPKVDETFKVLFNLDLNPKSSKKISTNQQLQKNVQQTTQNQNKDDGKNFLNNDWPSFEQFGCPKQEQQAKPVIPQKKATSNTVHNNNNFFQMFNNEQKNVSVHEVPKKNIDDFNFFQKSNETRKAQTKKMATSEIFTIQTLNKAVQQGTRRNSKNSNVSHHENNSKKIQKKQQNTLKQANKFAEFEFFQQKITNKANPQSKNKTKQTALLFGEDFYNADFFKKNTQKQPLKQVQQQNLLLKSVQTGLKLHELKQLIKSNPKVVINFADIKIQKTIGSGSAGEVYLGTYNKQVVAVKKVKTKQNPNALKQFQRQLVTYIKMKRHSNLVSLVGLCKSDQDYYLLTEYCSCGSLFDLLHKRANTVFLSWAQRTKMALQIARGMYALHAMKPIIIHRDLKSLNVFVAEKNGQLFAKVADFGLSRSPEADMMTSALGTLHWMAPQLLQNKQYSFKVDVYSYGILLWQICARKTPYHTLTSPMAIIKYVTMDKKRPGLQFIGAECPSALVMLMQKCWAHEPNQRPTFQNIIKVLQSIMT